MTETIIPSPIGYEALRLEDDTITRAPVIAWRIGAAGMSPVAFGCDEIDAVKVPAGGVVTLVGEVLDNERAWREVTMARRPKPAPEVTLPKPIEASFRRLPKMTLRRWRNGLVITAGVVAPESHPALIDLAKHAPDVVAHLAAVRAPEFVPSGSAKAYSADLARFFDTPPSREDADAVKAFLSTWSDVVASLKWPVFTITGVSLGGPLGWGEGLWQTLRDDEITIMSRWFAVTRGGRVHEVRA